VFPVDQFLARTWPFVFKSMFVNEREQKQTIVIAWQENEWIEEENRWLFFSSASVSFLINHLCLVSFSPSTSPFSPSIKHYAR
jgi:hypothetical protein